MKTAIEVMRQLDINPKGLGITGKDAAIKIILEQMDKGVAAELPKKVTIYNYFTGDWAVPLFQ